ncbi:MAG: tripartite tricarboxylate transporter TctB family protein [Desulfobacterales bacterium]|jgi:hypothetical protein
MKADKVIGLILIAFSIFMYVQADRLPPALFGALGADFVPKILFIILACCGAVLTIQCFIRERRIKAAAVELREDEDEPVDSSFTVKEFFNYYRYVILGFVAFLAYVIIMYYLGYPIATLIFMPVFMWVLGPRNKKAALITVLTTLGVTFIIYYSLLKLLRVFLPEGSLF